ncbi:hypothetical protein EA797_21520 [Stutzerimonas zhaodongensis]|uniref:Uncharacterized protein n=1 Tax=Stutzerimonas zhaodongensis TaxID=1176257 RepID=A0A3M2HG90_9GAMM|nr:hypothetical protein EA797_21520 [Stutzerimonas zhaodongensis]
MSNFSAKQFLVLAVHQALLGEIHPQLRQASIEADDTIHLVRLRFEYDGAPNHIAWEKCSCAAAEVISSFPAPWIMDDEHLSVCSSSQLSPLKYIVYRRWEPSDAA